MIYAIILVKHDDFCRGRSIDGRVVISSDTTSCFLLYSPSTKDWDDLVCDVNIFSKLGRKVSGTRYQGGSGYINLSDIQPGYTRELEIFTLYHEQWKIRKIRLFHYTHITEVEPGLYLFEVHEDHIDGDILWNTLATERVTQSGLVCPPSSFLAIPMKDWNILYPGRKVINDVENYWKQKQELYVKL